MLIGSLDDEVQEDLRNNKNFNTYTGAIYENVVADMLVKQGYNEKWQRHDRNGFLCKIADSLVPVEVKANDGATISLNNLINWDGYSDAKYGIKLCNKNIGFNGKFYTFPHFLAFLIKRFLSNREKWYLYCLPPKLDVSVGKFLIIFQ